MASYKIDIRGDKALAKGFKDAVKRARDLRPLFEQAYKKAFVPAMEQTFSRRGPRVESIITSISRVENRGGIPVKYRAVDPRNEAIT